MSNMKISNSVEEAQLVQLLLGWCTSCSVGALETSAPPEEEFVCRQNAAVCLKTPIS